MLLILTNEADVHPNPVIDILSKSNIPFFRLNTEKLLSDYDFHYEISEKTTFFKIKYKNSSLSIDSNQVSCVWERRPMELFATYDDYTDENVKRVILDEANGFLRFFRYSLTNVLWIGHPVIERQAGSKILQKIVAKEIGFNIPSTLFSNQLSSLDLFEGKDVAIKPISSFDIEAKGGSIVFYTRKKTYKELIDVGEIAFRNNINFIEEYIEKDFEVRVTVVKDSSFSAKINSQILGEEEGANDWRQGYSYGLTFTYFEIPERLEKMCFSFLNYFGLNFGCFDFIVNKNGEYIFLECNTNGQWLWLEEEAKLPISNKIADVFINEIKSKI